MIYIKIQEIVDNSVESLNYLERIVNDGSKSGFTSIHTTSDQTNPFFTDKYKVKKIWVEKEKVKSYGELPDFCVSNDYKEFVYIHPDWLLQGKVSYDFLEEGEDVIPTSSSRTVRMKGTKYYLKLCYPGKIGRLYREMRYAQLISGIELTAILNEMKNDKKVPKEFEFMPEICGKIYQDGSNEIGFLVREFPDDLNNYYVIPAFSLYSKDRNKENDEILLNQILALKENREKFILEQMCYPLIDIFFYAAFSEGLIFEMHSQNILYAFDKNWEVKKIVLRDLESVDKDISIRRALHKDVDFKSYPYKCISEELEEYRLRHSFMFDHKLGEYLLEPMIQCINKNYDIDADKINAQFRAYVQSKYGNGIKDFFPNDGCWYKYPNTEIDRTTRKRPFIALENPKYR